MGNHMSPMTQHSCVLPAGGTCIPSPIPETPDIRPRMGIPGTSSLPEMSCAVASVGLFISDSPVMGKNVLHYNDSVGEEGVATQFVFQVSVRGLEKNIAEIFESNAYVFVRGKKTRPYWPFKFAGKVINAAVDDGKQVLRDNLGRRVRCMILSIDTQSRFNNVTPGTRVGQKFHKKFHKCRNGDNKQFESQCDKCVAKQMGFKVIKDTKKGQSKFIPW